MKKLSFLSVVILFLCCSSYAQADDHSTDSLHINSAALSQLYAKNANFLWLKNRQYIAQTHDAMEFISGAVSHGFNPIDYHYDLLTYLDPETSAEQSQQFELLLSDGLLKLMQDIATGQRDPAEVDPKWLIPRAEFDAITYLQQALINSQLKHQLNELIPKLAEYQLLGTALARYQTYVDQGGWQQIPKTPLLNPGDNHSSIPTIRARLTISNHSLIEPSTNKRQFYEPQLVAAVKHFQHRHGLKVDGIIGSDTRQAMNVSAQQRIEQIKLNLDRLRWLPRNLGSRYLLVNIPNYTLSAIDKGEKKLNMRVIVGQKRRPTPSFTSQMSHLVFNPYWNVPRKLARLDLLPKQQTDRSYFYLHDIRVYHAGDAQGKELDPYSIDWHSVSKRHFPYTLRQDPGDNNALGKIKFVMPNQWSIYLHDTPKKSLFLETQRNFSSGCIRVEDPIGLANFTLANTPQQSSILTAIASGKNRWHKLKKPINIYTTYFTAWADNNGFIFAPDSYKRDLLRSKYL